MKYIEYEITGIPDEEAADIVVAELADWGFDTFSEYSYVTRNIKAYVPAEVEAENRTEIDLFLEESGYGYDREETADDTNWNALWESHFDPIEVGDRCYVRAPFHDPRPEYEYEIVIMPKMSFGTGHHATTWLMLDAILNANVEGKTGLDMGSGTGVLAILAILKGAAHVDAIDIDNWAYRNCVENAQMNGVQEKMTVLEGDASLLNPAEKYDFILANINRNILLRDMRRYADVLRKGGEILFSGFLEVDIPMIRHQAEALGLAFVESKLRDGWALVKCRK